MGRVTLPPTGRISTLTNIMQNAAIRLSASLASGSGNLEVNHFVMVPVTDGYMHVSDMYSIYGSARRSEVHVGPLGEVVGIGYNTAQIDGHLDTRGTTIENWHSPRESNRVIVACNYLPGYTPTVADTVGVAFSVIPRWNMLRGSA